MPEYKLAEAESKFADLIWEKEPVSSRELVSLASQELSWKSTTSYTVLRRLCDRGIFQNQNSTVTSLISKEEFYAQKSRQFVEDTFGGSLPKFLSAFIGGRKLSCRQAEEIKQMIDNYKEDTTEETVPSSDGQKSAHTGTGYYYE